MNRRTFSQSLFAVTLALTVLTVGGLSLVQAQEDSLFVDSGQSFGGDTDSQDVGLADLDGDGDLDAFIINNGVNSIWFNTGSATFVNGGQNFPTSEGQAVAMGDVDGDGDADAVVVYNGPNIFWRNRGAFSDFSFSSTIFDNSDSDSRDVALQDIDGDGDLDLLIVNSDAVQLWQNEAGVFSNTNQTLSTANGTSIAVADTDEDGTIDLALVTTNGANRLWQNDGSGTFSDTGLTLGSGNSQGAVFGDVDGDGDFDFVVANTGGNTVWLNDSTEGTVEFTNSGQSLGNAPSTAVDLADLDDDGDLDAYFANDGQANRVWFNNGNGTFSDSGQTIGDGNSQAVVLANLNGVGVVTKTFQENQLVITSGGRIDAFVVNAGGANKVWLNLTEQTPIRVQMVPQPNSGAAANPADLQIRVPYAVADGLGNASSVLIHGEQTGFLADNDGLSGGDTLLYTPQEALRAGELYQLIGTAQGAQTTRYVWEFRSEVEGGLGEFPTETDAVATGVDQRAVATGDLNGDGLVDSFFVGPENNQVWLNSGGGNLTLNQENIASGSDSQDVALADFDGDNDLDAFIANNGGNEVWLNNGSGTFSAGSSNLGSANSVAVALGDVDNDGDFDAVVANYNDGANTPTGQVNAVWLNNGNGGFSVANSIQLGLPPIDNAATLDVALADFNEDGYLDAIFVNDNSIQVASGSDDNREEDQVWFNRADGSGGFAFSGQRLAGSDESNSTTVIVGDINGDSYVDAIIGNKGENEVWLNNGPADGYTLGNNSTPQITTYAPHQSFFPRTGNSGTPLNTSGFSLADIDADGDLDLFESAIGFNDTDEQGYGVWVWENTYIPPEIPTRVQSEVTIFENGLTEFFEPIAGLLDQRIYDVATGDFDGDGDIDIVLANGGGESTVWLNQDDLKPSSTTPPGNGSTLTGSTVEVIFTRGISSSTVNGETFSLYAQQTGAHTGTYPVPPISTTAQFTPFPSDPFLPGERIFASLRGDLRSADGLTVLPQPYIWQFYQQVLSGTGVFSAATQLSNNSLTSADVILADVDNDDDLDAFVVNSDRNNQLFQNDGAGAFSTVSGSYGSNDQAAIVADLDGNDTADALIVGDGNTTVVLNLGGAATTQSISDGETSVGVDFGDFDHDGDFDAFVVNQDAPHTIYLNDGSGDFITQTVTNSSGDSRAVAIGDVDNDGILDAIVVSNGDNFVWLGDGSGSFSVNDRIGNTLGSGDSTAVATGDFNGDGFLDFVITNEDAADLVWFNDGTGNFPETSSQILPNSDGASRAVGVMDMDADNDLDLFIVRNGANQVYLNGSFGTTGAFQAGEPLRTTSQSNNTANSQAVTVGDVDGDGDLDALVANSGRNNQIWENVPFPKLAIVKRVADNVGVLQDGRPLTYTITISNVGSAPATNLVITDRIPLGATYDGPNESNDVVTFDSTDFPELTSLAVNSSTEVVLRVDVTDNFSDTISNNDYGVTSDELSILTRGSPVTVPVEVRVKGLQINFGFGTTFLVPENTDPITGFVSTPGNTNLYTFTAVVTPFFASDPIFYEWRTSEQSFDADNAGSANQQGISWTNLGRQVITVTAGNDQGSQTAVRVITITTLAVDEVMVSGPTTGLMGESYSFEAAVSPSEATLPLTFTWQVSDQAPVTLGNVSSLNNTQTYSWTTPGPKEIVVASTNFGEFVTGTHVITILTPPQQLSLSGPLTTSVGTSYPFTATVNPLTTSLPLTYVWQATQQAVQTYTSNLSHTLSFTWNMAGPQLITVAAFNPAGRVTNTYQITPTFFGVCQPIPAVTLDELPSSLVTVDTLVNFRSVITQGDPISFAWTVNGITQTELISSELEYTFIEAGVFTVTVNAFNECSRVADSRVVNVIAVSENESNLAQSYKTASFSNVNTGDTLTYTIVIRNDSDIPATDVQLNDPIPMGTTYNEGTATVNGQPMRDILAEGPIVWQGEVISGTPVIVQFAVTVVTTDSTTVPTNQATLTYSETEVITLTTAAQYNPGFTLTINDGALYTNIPTVTLRYSWSEPDDAPIFQAQLSNDGGFNADQITTRAAITNPTTEENWVLDTYGEYVIPRTVYARFRDEFGRYSVPVQDDIIYDPIPPTASLVEIDGLPADGFARQQTQAVNLRVTAADDNSGVATLELSNMAAFTASQQFDMTGQRTITVPWTLQSPGQFYLRVTDRAGNIFTTTASAVPPQIISTASPISETTSTANVFTFTTSISPFNTTQPLTYSWQAVDALTSTAQMSSLTNTAALTWPLSQTGIKTVTLTVQNIAGVISESYLITLPMSLDSLFLPIILRQ